MNEELIRAVLQNAAGVFLEHAGNPLTREAAYGLAVHVVMYMLDIDAPTACLLFPKPETNGD